MSHITSHHITTHHIYISLPAMCHEHQRPARVTGQACQPPHGLSAAVIPGILLHRASCTKTDRHTGETPRPQQSRMSRVKNTWKHFYATMLKKTKNLNIAPLYSLHSLTHSLCNSLTRICVPLAELGALLRRVLQVDLVAHAVQIRRRQVPT